MKLFDVAIIGSGPAGASAAFELANTGISTVIIDKEILPRYKTCGGGLVFRGRNSIPFDVSSAIDKEFYEVDSYFSKTKIKFTTKRNRPIISMIMRDAFDNLISNEDIRHEKGHICETFVQMNKGATDVILRHICNKSS